MTQDTTQDVIDTFDKNAMVELAKDMVRIPSFKEEETPMAHFLADYFSKNGCEVKLQEVEQVDSRLLRRCVAQAVENP